jgi:hypothetical protein
MKTKAQTNTQLSLTFEKAFHYINETYYQDRDVMDFLLVSEGHRNKTLVSFDGKDLVNLHSRMVTIFLNADENHSIVLVSDIYKNKPTATTIGFYNIQDNKLYFYVSPEIKYEATQYSDMMGFADLKEKNIFFRDRRDDSFYYGLKNSFNDKYSKEERNRLKPYLIKENMKVSLIMSDKYDSLSDVEPVTLYKVRQKRLDTVNAFTNQPPQYFDQMGKIQNINDPLFSTLISRSTEIINKEQVNISSPKLSAGLNIIHHYIEPVKMHKVKLYDFCDTYLDSRHTIYRSGDNVNVLDGTAIFYDLAKAQEHCEKLRAKSIERYWREKQKFETLPNTLIESFNSKLDEEESSIENEIKSLENRINELKERAQDVQKMREETKILSNVVQCPEFPIVPEYEKEIEVI